MWKKNVVNLVTAILMAFPLAAPVVPSVDAALPPVERVVVYKSRHLMQLCKGNDVIRSYRVALGRNPVGPKQRSGDCRTPEGTYTIDRHNKESRYYKSLHISYPNIQDLARARNHGNSPGGRIMIHGLPKGFEDLGDLHFRTNWTKGCIAVNNTEMDELWRLIADGTPITINP